mmetsp:Transcript_436/g.828  ORF Transcript_436/g.828 Transcript_436/m.828 type:complete len:295 (-) Transcript_436:81-965(-)
MSSSTPIITIKPLQMSRMDEAKDILNRAASVVSSVLNRRKWTIRLLTEFYPKDPSLQGLNVNRGQTVKVRLRSAESKESFLPFEYILGTIIHEITHIKISSHSAEFYKLMEELTVEVERDMSNGLTAEGTLRYAAFAGIPRRLGCSTGGSKPQDKLQLREAQVAAAEKRLKLGDCCKGSGQKLGGKSINNESKVPAVISTREVWSKKYETTISSQHSDQNATKQRRKRRNEALSSSVEIERPCGSGTSDNVCIPAELKGDSSSGRWTCNVCTLLNTESVYICDACGTFAPIVVL